MLVKAEVGVYGMDSFSHRAVTNMIIAGFKTKKNIAILAVSGINIRMTITKTKNKELGRCVWEVKTADDKKLPWGGTKMVAICSAADRVIQAKKLAA